MKQSSIRAFVAAVLLAAGLQSSAQPPVQMGVSTPESLKVTLKSAALQRRLRGPFEVVLFDTPYTQDVVKGNDQVGGLFTSTTPKTGSFTGTQIVMDEQALYSGTDPCTGASVTDAPVRMADDGASDLFITYEQPHPVTGLATGALPADPFKLTTDTPIDMHLVFPVTDSMVCLSDTPPLQRVVGKQTGLSSPFDLSVDTSNDQYVVSNSAADRITFHDRATVAAATDPNIPPAFIIAGADTQLSNPTGTAIDPATDDLYVANAGTDVITVYQRSDFAAHADGNVPPYRTITGPTTGLNTPGDIDIDTVNNQLVVVNGDGNSVTFYDNPAGMTGDVAPTYTIAGDKTGINAPCGVAEDTGTGDIYVTNNGNNSVTVYNRGDFATYPTGNLPYTRFFQGSKTGLSSPCGIDVDTARGEIAVASSLTSRVLFFDAASGGNVFPVRRLQGPQTLISGPTGLVVDDPNGDITILNNGGVAGANLILRCLGVAGANSQCNGSDQLASAHMIDPPILTNSIDQQTLYVNYSFKGTVDRVTGDLLSQTDPYTLVSLPTISAGYNYIWKIYDNQLRQEGNATNARLLPPQNVVLGLGSNPASNQVSNLELGCPSFTPFITLTLSTNCSSLPLITTPYPPQSAPDYRIIAALFGQPVIKKLPLHVAPLTVQEMPHLDMHLTLVPNSAIVTMDWSYVDGTGQPIQPPNLLIETQSISINTTRPFGDVDPCYKQVSGNATTLVFSSGSMGSDPRQLTNIKNNSCDILLNDVATITLTATDSFGNRYVYQVTPS